MVSNYKSTPAFSFPSEERVPQTVLIANKKAADPSPLSYAPLVPKSNIPGGTFAQSRKDRF